jgi:hypothetical protein
MVPNTATTMTILTTTTKIRTIKMATATGTRTKMMTAINDDYKMAMLTITLTTMTTNTMMTTMTTMMMTTKTTTAMIDNLAIFFLNIIMIIWAAPGANRRKYHGVSQLHPLDD